MFLTLLEQRWTASIGETTISYYFSQNISQDKQIMRLKNIFEVQCDIPAQLTLYWEILSASVGRYHITLLWHLNFLVVNIISLSKLSAHGWFPNLCNIQNLPVACKFYLLWSYILSLYKLLKKMTFKFEIIIWGFNWAVGSSNRISVMEHLSQ